MSRLNTLWHPPVAENIVLPPDTGRQPNPDRTVAEENYVGALPKKRVSNARQGNRRAHHKVKIPQLTICSNCRQPRRSHHACPNCGMYRGRQVFEVNKSRAAE